jgi:hypothetical protein
MDLILLPVISRNTRATDEGMVIERVAAEPAFSDWWVHGLDPKLLQVFVSDDFLRRKSRMVPLGSRV